MIKIGLIGGSGFEKAGLGKHCYEKFIDTAYGKPSSAYRVYETDNITFYQINRHGDFHDTPPHLVNYRANIDGFKQLGVERIISVTAVGAIDTSYHLQDFVLPHNAIDFTNGRKSTFFEGDKVLHVDLTYPFCQELRKSFIKAANISSTEVRDGGIYLCVNGPRLETAAEINFFKTMGGDMVGMTLFPEVALAREAEICYLNVCVITNFAAGLVAGHKLTATEVEENGKQVAMRLFQILKNLDKTVEDSRQCFCGNSLEGAGF